MALARHGDPGDTLDGPDAVDEIVVDPLVGHEQEAEPVAPAQAEERLARAPRTGFAGRQRFLVLVVLALLVHAAIIAAFLWRDANDKIETARIEETPVEVIVEKPPEPPKPTPPPQKKPPEPPKPKEELEKPALSAPRAPNEEKVETERTQPKTSVPKAPTPPSEGQPQPKPAVAPPKEAAPPAETKEGEAKREEDKTKPDAEALDRARPKVSKQTKAKEAKAAPRRKQKPTNALAALAGSSQLAEMTFAKPTPKSPVYGGTEDVRYLAIVEGMLEAKVQQLPRTPHWQAGGHVVIFFQIDVTGRVIARDYWEKSGYPDIDQLAMRALLAAAPFPPPPRGVDHGLIWGSKFDGQLPKITVTRR